MIRETDLRNMAVSPDELSDRQREVAVLVSSYVSVAHEMPSAGWLSRRLSISRQRAQQHLETLRERGWFDQQR